MVCNNLTDGSIFSLSTCVHGFCDAAQVCICDEGYEHLNVFTFNSLCSISTQRKTILLTILAIACANPAVLIAYRLAVRGGSAYIRNAAYVALVAGLSASIFFSLLIKAREAHPLVTVFSFVSIGCMVYMACLLIMGFLQPIHRITRLQVSWFRKTSLRILLISQVCIFAVLEALLAIYHDSIYRERIMRIVFIASCLDAVVSALYVYVLLRVFSSMLDNLIQDNIHNTPSRQSDIRSRVVRFHQRIQRHRFVAGTHALILVLATCATVTATALGYGVPEEAYLYVCFIIPSVTISPSILLNGRRDSRGRRPSNASSAAFGSIRRRLTLRLQRQYSRGTIAQDPRSMQRQYTYTMRKQGTYPFWETNAHSSEPHKNSGQKPNADAKTASLIPDLLSGS